MQLTDSFYKQKFIIVYPNQFGYHTDSYKYCEYLNDRYDISYICFDQGFEKLELPHINVIYIQFNTGKIRRLIELFLEVFKNCNKNPDNILFVIQFKFSFLLGLFAKSKKKILDYRTGDLSINPLKRWLKNRWMSMDSLSYDKITVISDGVCKNIFLLNRKRIIILPLGADVISSKKHEYKQIRLLYVGAIHTRNVYQTIEGLAEFISMNKNLRSSINYTIIGFGPQHIITHLLETIKEKQVEDIVKYVGRVKYPDLTPYFDQCNVGISYIPKTPFFDYQPATKTFEYVLSGLYTIATDTFENRKVINLSNGILCDDTPFGFAKALEGLIKMKSEIDEVAVRNSLLSYHWKAIVNNILKPIL